MKNKMMTAIQLLDNILNKNPSVFMATVLILFGLQTWNSYVTKENFHETKKGLDRLSSAVEYQTYDFPERLISRGFSGAESGADAIAKTQEWKVNGWGAQLTALNILCDQEDRVNLSRIVDKETAVSICRIAR